MFGPSYFVRALTSYFLYILGGFLDLLRSFVWDRVSQYNKREIQIKIFEHIQRLSLRWHISKKNKIEEVIGIMERGNESIDKLLSSIIFR